MAVRTESRPRPQRLVPLGQRLQPARLSLNGELVLQSRPPAVRMAKALVELPIGSFLQATQKAEDTLADLVISAVGKVKSVADLFCGVGPFALRLADAHASAPAGTYMYEFAWAAPGAGDPSPSLGQSSWCGMDIVRDSISSCDMLREAIRLAIAVTAYFMRRRWFGRRMRRGLLTAL